MKKGEFLVDADFFEGGEPEFGYGKGLLVLRIFIDSNSVQNHLSSL